MNTPSPLQASLQEKIKRILARKDLVMSIGIILSGLLVANFLYQKQQQKLKRIEADIAQEGQRISLAKELTILDDTLTKIGAPYIKKDTSFTIDKFNELAAGSDVKIASISVDDEMDSGLYTVTNYRLSVKADYHNLGKFISALESLADMVKVEELTLSPEGGQARAQESEREGARNILNINMRISAAFVKTL